MAAADLLAVALRGVSWVAAIQAAGVPLFLWLFGGALTSSAERIGVLATRTALLATVLVVLHQLVEPARLTGSLRDIADPMLHGLLLGTDAGTAAAVRVLGLVLIAVGVPRRSEIGAAAALIGGTLVAVSFAFMGHTAADEQRWLLAALLIVHLLAVTFWFGALWPLAVVARLEAPKRAGQVVERFSAIAVRFVPLIFLAGVGLAIALLPGLAALGNAYGIVLIAKTSVFVLLMILAGTNRWRLGPGLAAANNGAAGRFRAVVLAEWVLIAAVLLSTSAMTGLFSPEQ